MTQAVSATTTRLAGRDLSPRQAIVAACVAMAAIVMLDLGDGRLGLLFSVGFVLVAVTAPMAVDARSLLPTGVLPPVLMIGSLLAVCLASPDAIQVTGMDPDAGTIARLIAGTIDHGLTVVFGHGIALALIGWRVLTDPGRRIP